MIQNTEVKTVKRVINEERKMKEVRGLISYNLNQT